MTSNTLRGTVLAIMAMAMLLLASPRGSEAKDAQFKYIIPTMTTKVDADKIKAFIKTLPGVKEIDIYLGQNAVVVLFDNAVLDNEKFQLRIPLKNKIGYPVETVVILFETQKDEI